MTVIDKDGKELNGIDYLEWLVDNFPTDNISLIESNLSFGSDFPPLENEGNESPIILGSPNFYGPRACICSKRGA